MSSLAESPSGNHEYRGESLEPRLRHAGGRACADLGAGAVRRRRPQAVRRARQPHAAPALARVRNLSRQRPHPHRFPRARDLRLDEAPRRHRRAGPAGFSGQGRRARGRGSHALSIDAAKLPVRLQMRRMPLCERAPYAGESVVVATPEGTARSRVLPRQAIPAELRARFDTQSPTSPPPEIPAPEYLTPPNFACSGSSAARFPSFSRGRDLARRSLRQEISPNTLSRRPSSKPSSRPEFDILAPGRARTEPRHRFPPDAGGRLVRRSNLVDGVPLPPK